MEKSKLKLTKVRKSNYLTQANFEHFSLSAYRVFLSITSKMQKHDLHGNLIPLHLADRHCSLSVSEYAKDYGIQENHAYEILKFTVRKLLKTSFTLPVAAGLLEINVCAQALYRKDGGRIDVEFTPNIMPHLAAVSEQFTMYNLREIAGFGSIYTTRLYELLMQWKIIGKLEITTADLRHALGCINVLKQYNHFKTFGFGHAVMEINNHYEINLNFEEIKTGRTVTSVIFTFKPTERHLAYDVVKQKYRTQLTRPKKIKTRQESSLATNITNEKSPHPDTQVQNLMIEPITVPNSEIQKPTPQKKKKFLGLF